ncbi:MAG: hypothetical protein M3394_01600 [Actinomycetota bacterium]|nr:hypothetical protein [Actinomycetota bacterium]
MAVTIADDVFGAAPGGEDANEALLVTATDTAAARRALERAGERFRLVDGLGVEHDGREGDFAWWEQDGLAGHTCKYVSDVSVADGGLYVYLDCQDLIPPPMGQAYVRILREELERANVVDAVVRAADRNDGDDNGAVRRRDHPWWDPAPEAVPDWVVQFEGGHGRPPGFPPEIELPTDAIVVYAEAKAKWTTTVVSDHEGSWGAELVLAVDGLERGMEHFVRTLPNLGYVLGNRVVQEREEGQVVGIGFAGKGLEIEVNGVGPDVATQIDPTFRKLREKAAVLVVAFQRPPRS